MPEAADAPHPLTIEERRWLHDKYERLAEEEGNLAGSRTSYFATIAAVLVTGLVVATSDLLADPTVLVLFATFLSMVGIIIASVWWVLLHRTADAQALWREAARRIEAMDPPIETRIEAPITLRSGETISVDLSRPYTTHSERFSPTDPRLSWQDRLDPAKLTEVMPLALLGIWIATVGIFWGWFLFLR